MLKLSASTKTKLLKLADFLATTVKNQWFHMGFWATDGFIEKECGTTACALGWATVCFPRSGLFLEVETWGKIVPHKVRSVRYTHRGEKYENLEAAEKFFGIDNCTAYYLFMPESYPKNRGRRVVINRLRKVVDQGVPESLTPGWLARV